MKKLITFLCLTLFGYLYMLGQTPTYYIKYDYDAAGNRISRKYLQVTLPQLRSLTVPEDSVEAEADLDELKVTIYPNPTKGAIIVGLSSFTPENKIGISLFTSDGRKLQQVDVQSDRTPLDLTKYSSGLYLLHITMKEKKIECKIIKQ